MLESQHVTIGVRWCTNMYLGGTVRLSVAPGLLISHLGVPVVSWVRGGCPLTVWESCGVPLGG